MIVFTSDWHLHPFKSYSTVTEAGLNSRLSEQITAIAGVVDWAGSHGIPLHIHAGDVFHSQGETIPKDVIRAGYVLFEKARNHGIQNIVVPGNHDIHRGKTVFRPFQDVAEIIVEPQSRRIGEYVFTFIPYMRSRKAFYRAIADEAKKIDWNSDRIKFLVCHQIFNWTLIGPSQFQFKTKDAVSTDAVKSYNYVIAGHCHNPQIVKQNIYCVGTPLQHDYGDEGNDHGFLLWDDSRMIFMPVSAPRFHTIKITNEDDYERFVEDYIDGDYYRVIVENGVEVDLPRTRKIEVVKKGIAKVKVRVDIEKKDTTKIISEVIEQHPTSLDKKRIFDKAVHIWEEAENEKM